MSCEPKRMIFVGCAAATSAARAAAAHPWPARYPAELAARLKHLIDTPDG